MSCKLVIKDKALNSFLFDNNRPTYSDGKAKSQIEAEVDTIEDLRDLIRNRLYEVSENTKDLGGPGGLAFMNFKRQTRTISKNISEIDGIRTVNDIDEDGNIIGKKQQNFKHVTFSLEKGKVIFKFEGDSAAYPIEKFIGVSSTPRIDIETTTVGEDQLVSDYIDMRTDGRQIPLDKQVAWEGPHKSVTHTKEARAVIEYLDTDDNISNYKIVMVKDNEAYFEDIDSEERRNKQGIARDGTVLLVVKDTENTLTKELENIQDKLSFLESKALRLDNSNPRELTVVDGEDASELPIIPLSREKMGKTLAESSFITRVGKQEGLDAQEKIDTYVRAYLNNNEDHVKAVIDSKGFETDAKSSAEQKAVEFIYEDKFSKMQTLIDNIDNGEYYPLVIENVSSQISIWNNDNTDLSEMVQEEPTLFEGSTLTINRDPDDLENRGKISIRMQSGNELELKRKVDLELDGKDEFTYWNEKVFQLSQPDGSHQTTYSITDTKEEKIRTFLQTDIAYAMQFIYGASFRSENLANELNGNGERKGKFVFGRLYLDTSEGANNVRLFYVSPANPSPKKMYIDNPKDLQIFFQGQGLTAAKNIPKELENKDLSSTELSKVYNKVFTDSYKVPDDVMDQTGNTVRDFVAHSLGLDPEGYEPRGIDYVNAVSFPKYKVEKVEKFNLETLQTVTSDQHRYARFDPNPKRKIVKKKKRRGKVIGETKISAPRNDSKTERRNRVLKRIDSALKKLIPAGMIKFPKTKKEIAIVEEAISGRGLEEGFYTPAFYDPNTPFTYTRDGKTIKTGTIFKVPKVKGKLISELGQEKGERLYEEVLQEERLHAVLDFFESQLSTKDRNTFQDIVGQLANAFHSEHMEAEDSFLRTDKNLESTLVGLESEMKPGEEYQYDMGVELLAKGITNSDFVRELKKREISFELNAEQLEFLNRLHAKEKGRKGSLLTGTFVGSIKDFINKIFEALTGDPFFRTDNTVEGVNVYDTLLTLNNLFIADITDTPDVNVTEKKVPAKRKRRRRKSTVFLPGPKGIDLNNETDKILLKQEVDNLFISFILNQDSSKKENGLTKTTLDNSYFLDFDEFMRTTYIDRRRKDIREEIEKFGEDAEQEYLDMTESLIKIFNTTESREAFLTDWARTSTMFKVKVKISKKIENRDNDFLVPEDEEQIEDTDVIDEYGDFEVAEEEYSKPEIFGDDRNIGMVKALSKPVKILLSRLPTTVNVDGEYQQVYNHLGMEDFGTPYSLAAQEVRRIFGVTTSKRQALERLMEKKDDPFVEEILDRLKITDMDQSMNDLWNSLYQEINNPDFPVYMQVGFTDSLGDSNFIMSIGGANVKIKRSWTGNFRKHQGNFNLVFPWDDRFEDGGYDGYDEVSGITYDDLVMNLPNNKLVANPVNLKKVIDYALGNGNKEVASRTNTADILYNTFFKVLGFEVDPRTIEDIKKEKKAGNLKFSLISGNIADFINRTAAVKETATKGGLSNPVEQLRKNVANEEANGKVYSIKTLIDTLAREEAKYTRIVSNQYALGAGGKPTPANSKPNFANLVERSINDQAFFEGLMQGVEDNEMYNILSHLNSESFVNSPFYQRIKETILPTGKGSAETKELRKEYREAGKRAVEFINYNGDQNIRKDPKNNTEKTTNNLTDKQWLHLNILTMLRNGFVELPRAETAATAAALKFSDKRLWIPGTTEKSINEQLIKTEMRALASELLRVRQETREGKLLTDNYPKISLSDFKYLESFDLYEDSVDNKEVQDAIREVTLAATSSTTGLGMMFYDAMSDQLEIIEDAVLTYHDHWADLLIEKYEVLDIDAVREYKKGLDENDPHQSMPKELLLKKFSHNYIVHQRESMRLLYGGIHNYPNKGIHKRLKDIISSGKMGSTDRRDWDLYSNDFYDVTAREKQSKEDYNSFHINTMFIDNDVIKLDPDEVETKGKNKGKPTQRAEQAKTLLANGVESRFRAFINTYQIPIEDHAALRAIIEKDTREELFGKDGKGGPLSKMDSNDAQSYMSLDYMRNYLKEKGKWTDKDQKLYKYELAYYKKHYLPGGEKILLPPKPDHRFAQLKLQYRGNAVGENNHAVFLKSSYASLSPSAMHNTPLESLVKKAYEQNIHVFASQEAIKLGIAEGNDSKKSTIVNFFGGSDSNGVNQKFIDNDNFSDQTIQLYSPTLIEQIDTDNKQKTKNRIGSQFSKEIFSNVMHNGRYVDADDNKGILTDSTKKFEYNHNKYKGALRGLLNTQLDKLRLQIGVELGDTSFTMKQSGIGVLVNAIEDQLMKTNDGEIPAPIKDWIHETRDSISNVTTIENTGVDSTLINLITGIVNKNIYRFTIDGTLAVQLSASGFTAGFDNKLKYMPAIGEPSEMMVPMSDNFKPLLKRADVRQRASEKKISKVDALNELIAENAIPADLITAVAYRIPTQLLSSAGVFKIKKFLSASQGPVAILPLEVVGQMGSDFDFDKINLWYPSLDPETGDRITEEYSGDPKKKAKKLNSDKARYTNQLLDATKNSLLHPYNFYNTIKPIDNNYMTDELAELKTKSDQKDYRTNNDDNFGDELDLPTGMDIYAPTVNLQARKFLIETKNLLDIAAANLPFIELFMRAGARMGYPDASGNIVWNRKTNKKTASEVLNIQLLTDAEQASNTDKDGFRLDNQQIIDGVGELKAFLTKVAIQSGYINKSVDGAKKPDLGAAGFNEFTKSVYMFSNFLSIPFSRMKRFMKQPIIFQAGQLVDSGVNKETAVVKMAERYGIPQEYIIKKKRGDKLVKAGLDSRRIFEELGADYFFEDGKFKLEEWSNKAFQEGRYSDKLAELQKKKRPSKDQVEMSFFERTDPEVVEQLAVLAYFNEMDIQAGQMLSIQSFLKVDTSPSRTPMEIQDRRSQISLSDKNLLVQAEYIKKVLEDSEVSPYHQDDAVQTIHENLAPFTYDADLTEAIRKYSTGKKVFAKLKRSQRERLRTLLIADFKEYLVKKTGTVDGVNINQKLSDIANSTYDKYLLMTAEYPELQSDMLYRTHYTNEVEDLTDVYLQVNKDISDTSMVNAIHQSILKIEAIEKIDDRFKGLAKEIALIGFGQAGFRKNHFGFVPSIPRKFMKEFTDGVLDLSILEDLDNSQGLFQKFLKDFEVYNPEFYTSSDPDRSQKRLTPGTRRYRDLEIKVKNTTDAVKGKTVEQISKKDFILDTLREADVDSEAVKNKFVYIDFDSKLPLRDIIAVVSKGGIALVPISELKSDERMRDFLKVENIEIAQDDSGLLEYKKGEEVMFLYDSSEIKEVKDLSQSQKDNLSKKCN